MDLSPVKNQESKPAPKLITNPYKKVTDPIKD